MSLYNPQVLPCVSHTTLPFEELYKATLCNLAWEQVFWRTFLLRAVEQLFAFDFTFINQLLKKQKAMCCMCAGPQKL
jgi:hypothetical protein